MNECMTFIPPGCGNLVTNGDEECDDGNQTDGDGCSHQCRMELCGNGVVDPNEDCDDLNTNACDDCSPSCKTETCGNGVVDCGEECDDGAANGTPGSNCLPGECRPGPVCSVASDEPCIPCGTALDCDAVAGVCGAFTCNAQGRCAETTPLACNDGNLCNGTEICVPATGCQSGTALDCTGTDACVTYACDAAVGCTSDPLAGFPLMRCRLSVARGLVDAAPDAALAKSARRKLAKLLGVVDKKLVLAEGNARKAAKALRIATQRVAAAQRFVTKQRGKKITAETADALQSALGALPPALVLPAS